MLKCVELTPQGLSTYHLPLEPVTAPRLHHERSQTSKVVSYETRQVDFALQPAALSLKCSFRGPVHYMLDGRQLTVEEDRYLVVNHEHHYSSFVQNPDEVAVFSLFFGQPLVREVASSLTRTQEELLASPRDPGAEPIFFEHLLPHETPILESVRAIRAAQQADAMETSWLQERLHGVLEQMVRANRALTVRMEALPAVKASTRAEVFRRVHVARDFLLSHSCQPIDLEALAAAACMAPHHFLRSYKQVMGQTPHQHLLELRLERAHRLLRQGMSVADAAHSVGFESWEHFSRQFRRRYQTSPGALRRAA